MDPTRICELLIGLPEVNVLGAQINVDGPLKIHMGAALLK